MAFLCLFLVTGCNSQNRDKAFKMCTSDDVRIACELYFKLPIDPESIKLSSESEALQNVFGVPRIEDIPKSELENDKIVRVFQKMTQEGHQVWHFETSSKTWDDLRGREGYVTWNGKEITSIIIWRLN